MGICEMMGEAAETPMGVRNHGKDESTKVESKMRSTHVNEVKTQPGGSSRYGCLRSSAAVARSSGFLWERAMSAMIH